MQALVLRTGVLRSFRHRGIFRGRENEREADGCRIPL